MKGQDLKRVDVRRNAIKNLKEEGSFIQSARTAQ